MLILLFGIPLCECYTSLLGGPFSSPINFYYSCSPNETKKPRTLSKLNDTSAWERRRIKGKIAVQKMVVGLMELYLHRLKQKRPPYPKNPSMVEFAGQFPFEPTPDQKLVQFKLVCISPPCGSCFCSHFAFIFVNLRIIISYFIVWTIFTFVHLGKIVTIFIFLQCRAHSVVPKCKSID